MPQAVLALQVTQRTNLCFVGVQNERLDPLIQRTLEHIQIVQNTQREPAVAAAPEHAAEVVHPIERPAVEEQAGVGIVQILDVHQHLLDGFIDPLLLAVLLAHPVQEQDGHEQGVDPHFALVQTNALTVAVGTGDVLETALTGAWDALHQPLCPVQTESFKLRVVVDLVQFTQGQQRSGRIDIAGRQTLRNILLEPVVQEGAVFLRILHLGNFEQSVQADALRPVPLLDAEVTAEKSDGLAAFFQSVLVFGGTKVHQLLNDEIQLLLDQFFFDFVCHKKHLIYLCCFDWLK